jgi:hypothetical protein
VLLEALRGLDDDVLVAAAPHVHALLATFAAAAEPEEMSAYITRQPSDAPRTAKIEGGTDR